MARPATNEQYKTSVTQLGSTLHTDLDPIDQPRGTHRFALNAVNEAVDGQRRKLSNERANVLVTALVSGFFPIGDRYIGDDLSVVISTHPISGASEIGVITKDHKYTTIVNTLVLGLSINNQCDIIFRLRRGNERVIYWVDALNLPRTFNLDRPQNFWNSTYAAYIKGGGDPTTFLGEKWDLNSFNLIKSFQKIPAFSDIAEIETGNILPGSYNFAVQYVDNDLNPTEWITTSNTVNIYNDTFSNPFHKIRGSKNVDTATQSWQRANKSIKLVLTNLDESFPYYRVAIIRATGVTGVPDKALASEIFPTTDGNFIYTGNDGNLTEVALSDILIEKEIIFAPNHIEQLENRLELANTRGKSVNWCGFQKYASKIGADLTTMAVSLNNQTSFPNVKNPKSTFFFRGYMPGEVYSFGICYIFSDGFVSPVFHIPGRSSANTTSSMLVYELTNSYLDIHNCATDNYWGVDVDGNALVGEKQRHHRFPFRRDVNKPLFTTSAVSNSVTKYRLRVNFTLNPSWTPNPPPDDDPYPEDVANTPLVIPFGIIYQITGATGTNTYTQSLTKPQVGIDYVVYDDIVTLDDFGGSVFGQIDPTTAMGSTYLTGSNDRFVMNLTYDTHIDTAVFTDDASEIFGIEFGNIEKPHPDVIGFYIVRNERLDDDRLILDNALFGPMTEYQQYKNFGFWTPKQFEDANNCGALGSSGKTLGFYNKGVWFWNPEFQFFNRRTEFDHIEVQGKYSEDEILYPTISNVDNSECNSGHSKGVYIQDVQAGTSYNPDVNKKKDKDDDGFDLVIGYKATKFTYAQEDTFLFPVKKKVLYLNAASYQNFDNNTYYNTSVDNKIGQYITDDALDPTEFNDVSNENHLIYGSLVRNVVDAYSNFMTRPYYKELNNPVYFSGSLPMNQIKVFNGDAQISSASLTSSVFYDIVVADRAKKSKLWKIVAGSLIIIASVAAEILTAGAATPLVVPALSFGVSLLSAGIKFEQMKSMIEVDYEKGLKQTVFDGGMFNTIRDTIELEDDTIRWFSDLALNLYVESTVPFGLRSGLTCGVTDFTDSPADFDEPGFRSYITEKLTSVDRDQGSGRLYKGFASAEVYDMNLDFMRFNKEKQYDHLPLEYDCCNDFNETFPVRVWYSEQSFQEELVDNYRVFLPNNFRDIEGEHGEITDMYRLGNSLFIHTKEGLWQLPQNVQERITNEIVSFIGTGEFFNIPPRKVLDDDLSSGGTSHKWGTVKTKNGVLFVSEIENKIYLHSDTVHDLTAGNRGWFKEHLKSFLVKQLFDSFGVTFLHDNNPANPNGVGYLSTYDTRYERILITKRDYLILPAKLSVLIITNVIPVSGNDFVYCTSNGKFYNGTSELALSNTDFFENKSFTISYSFDDKGFVSWHSYIPNYYIHSQNSLYSVLANNQIFRHHHNPGLFQTFYGVYHPHIIEFVKVSSPLEDSISVDLTFQTKARSWDANTQNFNDEHFITYNKAILYNAKQSSGEQGMRVKQTTAPSADWYSHAIKNEAGIILLSRTERNWNINHLRDYTIDSLPLFTNDWNTIKAKYFIDKLPNPAATDFNKAWNELQQFRDKYLIIRLTFDVSNSVNLIFNFTLETEQTSNR